MNYMLRQASLDHTSDVRYIHILNDECFISCSRDMTAIIWKFNNTSMKYEPNCTLKGHHNFINCCIVLPKNDKIKDDLFLTGGQDKIILGHNVVNSSPICRFSGHCGAVSSLCEVTNTTFASGSWDHEIFIWDAVLFSCLKKICIHFGTVWAILKLQSGNFFASGSADKFIQIYDSPSFTRTVQLKGHSDSVRGLAKLEGDMFLSCSNDGTVRRWNARSGEELDVIYCGDFYLYSIAALPDLSLIIAGGENHNLVLMNEKGFRKIMRVPQLTVWTVGILGNNDIIIAGSDNYIRIYTSQIGKSATQLELDEYNRQLQLIQKPKRTEKVQKDKLPGVEALLVPGDVDGRLQIICENDKPVCYQWSEKNTTWILIGDVADTASDPLHTESTPGKSEEKGHDFVFNIDVEDGAPPIKLPYNLNQNPYTVAEEFIHKHDLPQAYKEQIVNFILTHTPTSSSASFSRHENVQDLEFQIKNYILFDSSDMKKPQAKLMEFANMIDREDNQEWIKAIVHMAGTGIEPTPYSIIALNKLLSWPHEYQFPLLDVLRSACRHRTVVLSLCTVHNRLFNNIIVTCLSNKTYSCINTMFIFKILTNIAQVDEGRTFLRANNEFIFNSLVQINFSEKKVDSLEIAAASLVVNIILMNVNDNNQKGVESYVNFALVMLSKHLTSNDATYRLVSGLITAQRRLKLHIDVALLVPLGKLNSTDEVSEKIKKCVHQIFKNAQHITEEEANKMSQK